MIATNNAPAIASLYRSGFSEREVAAIMGIDRKTVARRLVAQGEPIRPSNNVKRSAWLTEKGSK